MTMLDRIIYALAYESGQQSMQAEIERLNKAIKTQATAVRTLRANEETELNQLREERKKWHGAISTLDSERAANAILTTEIERLRAALRACRRAIAGKNEEPRARVREIVDGAIEEYDRARQALGDKQ